jgi:hypothetical protein
LIALAGKRGDGARQVLQVVSSSLYFDNDALKEWIVHQREAVNARGAAAPLDGDAALAAAPASTDSIG